MIQPRTLRFGVAVVLALGATLPTVARAAGDPVVGKALYNNTNGAPISCASVACHGTDPTQNKSKILRGANSASTILDAISGDKGNMGFLSSFVSGVDADNIAAYLGNPTAATPAPRIALAPATLAFGNQTVATASQPMTVTVTNGGSANLVLSNIATGGANAGDFARAGTCANNVAVAPSGSCAVVVTFTPQATGARTGNVTISHNASGGTTTFALSGTGASAPTAGVGLSAAALTFADQTVNTTSATKTLTVTNAGTASLVLASVGASGANAAEFARSGSCAGGLTVPPGGNCSVVLAFTPMATGNRSATIDLASNAPGSPHQVPVQGNGVTVATPALSATPSLVAFGNQTVGTTAAARSVTLSNPGTASLALAGVAINGSGFAHSTTCGASLAPGGTCRVDVTFTPPSAGGANGALTLTPGAPIVPVTIPLSGTGVDVTATPGGVTLTPLVLEYAGQRVGTTSAARSIAVRNTGTGPLSLVGATITGTDATDFRRAGTCTLPGTLAAGATCTLTVTFTPGATGDRNALLTLTSNGTGTQTVPLHGVGTDAVRSGLRLSTREIEFGRQAVGTTSRARRVVATNRGEAPVSIASVAVLGDFAQANNCPSVIAPGATCTLDVTFRPTGTGERRGTVSIAVEGAANPARLQVEGRGTSGRTRGNDDD